ncbi:MAG TPA: hypothetical protein VGK67_38060 [Myxococcales bacterium]
MHTSGPSLFRTFEQILGIPPMNRYDALATPLTDAFSSTPDTEPYVVLPRTVPDGVNSGGGAGAGLSAQMDFSVPDRNPDLGDLLIWKRTGYVRPGSALEQALSGEPFELRKDEDD